MLAALRRLLRPPPPRPSALMLRREPVLDLAAIDVAPVPLPVSALMHLPDSDSGRAPAISKYASPVRLREVPVEEHGRRLLRWLQGDHAGAVGFDSPPVAEILTLLADDVLPAYQEMCAELRWVPQPWNRTGKYFREALGDGRKTYAWVLDDDGVRHRLRVYKIPMVVVAPLASAPTGRRAERVSVGARNKAA